MGRGRRSPGGRGGPGEEGSASVTGAFIASALVGVTALVLLVGAGVLARHQAQHAADLAALAGAATVFSGGCREAEDVAGRNGGTLVACVVAGADVVVRVRVTLQGGPWAGRRADAVARAGPADVTPSGRGPPRPTRRGRR